MAKKKRARKEVGPQGRAPVPVRAVTRLVVGTYRTLRVGDAVDGVTDPWTRQPTRTACRVVGEATEADYWACLADLGVSDAGPPWFDAARFYFVVTD